MHIYKKENYRRKGDGTTTMDCLDLKQYKLVIYSWFYEKGSSVNALFMNAIYLSPSAQTGSNNWLKPSLCTGSWGKHIGVFFYLKTRKVENVLKRIKTCILEQFNFFLNFSLNSYVLRPFWIYWHIHRNIVFFYWHLFNCN